MPGSALCHVTYLVELGDAWPLPSEHWQGEERGYHGVHEWGAHVGHSLLRGHCGVRCVTCERAFESQFKLKSWPKAVGSWWSWDLSAGGLGGSQDAVPSLKNRGEGRTLTGPLPHFRTWKKTRLPAGYALLKTESGGFCPFLSICFGFFLLPVGLCHLPPVCFSVCESGGDSSTHCREL